MLVLPGKLLAQIIAHARRGSPQEVCGWLAGRGNRAVRAYPVPNAAADPERAFRMEPEAQLCAMREIREASLDLTATYHSHPRTPAEPSARDLELAAYPDSFHLIVSLANDEPEVRCYHVTARGCQPVILFDEKGLPR